jgi:hypothetical protein
VTYRDDLRAAIDRADALARMLDDARDDRDRLAAELEATRAEIERLRAIAAEHEPPPPQPAPSGASRSRSPALLLAVGLIACAAIAIVVFNLRRAHGEAWCTFDTVPSGAGLYAVYGQGSNADGVEHYVGTAPYSASLEQWLVHRFMNRSFVARLKGYREAAVEPPIGATEADGCHDRRVTLQPE